MQIKFYKDAVPDILAGRKTLEPRPRSNTWIDRVLKAETADLTFGPRFGSPTVFATAKILKVEIRPFESTTKNDLQQIALGWGDRTVEEFVEEYTKWFSKQLEKGQHVAWVYFKVMDKKPVEI